MEHTICPNLKCQSLWDLNEIDLQECDSCGWPSMADIYDEDERYQRLINKTANWLQMKREPNGDLYPDID